MYFKIILFTVTLWFLPSYSANLSNRTDINKIKQVAYNIDVATAGVFRSNNFELPEIADDSVYLRRLFLVLCGRIPSLQETESFLNWDEPNKRQLILPQLLQSEDYEHHKLNWYRDLFRIRTMAERRQYKPIWTFEDWLQKNIREGKTWKDMSFEMLSARGSSIENPETGFYLANGGVLNTNVGYTFETFLATNMACAECHDHPFEDYSRKDFFQVAAFMHGVNRIENVVEPVYLELIKGISLEERRNVLPSNSIAYLDITYFGSYLSGKGLGKIPLPKNYQYTNGKPGQKVSAKAPFAKEALSQSSIPEGYKKNDSLVKFAGWVTSDKNERFAANIANRIWKRMMGTALYANNDFYEPSEELPYGELMDALIQAVKDLNYDTQALEYALAMTKSFQFVSYKDYAFDGSFEMLQGRQLRRMSAEQIWDSWALLTNNKNLFIPQETIEIKPVEEIILGGKHVNVQNLREAIDSVSKAVDQSSARESLTRLKEIIQSGSKASLPKTINEQNQLNFSHQLSSPAKARHPIRLFGQANRIEVNNYNKAPNMSQALAVLNGPVPRYISYNNKASINQAIANAKTVNEKINKIYLSTYSRLPKDWEIKECLDIVNKLGEREGFPVILTAILASNEFIFIQ